jgi:hypothetical protein
MRFQPLIRRISLGPAAAAAVTGILLAGCGSSGSPGSGSSSSPAPSSSSGTSGSGSAADAAITSDWVAFFASSTPLAKRVSLLQNGQQFQTLIAAQAKSGLASSASAKVTKVSNVTSTQATVTYSILLGGQSALPHQTGVAVYQGGTWKVGDKSFCALLVLENGKKGLPAACAAAG